MTWAAWWVTWLGMRVAAGTAALSGRAGLSGRARLLARRLSGRAGLSGRRARRRPWMQWGQAGQATTEYALVLIGVAAVAMALTTWAGGGKIGSFLDSVFDRMLTTAK